MKRICLFALFLAVAGKLMFADSTFLPALEFHYLYKENAFIFVTSDNGISEEEYIGFLLSEEVPLGERIALVSALASYFEWIDLDDNPDNDDENYFETYALSFKEKAQKRYDDAIPPFVQLLAVLMDDYQTFDPNTQRYDQLASEMPNSLAAQSVKVIAFAYDVLYNRRWNRVERYEDEYLTPYKESWEKYDRDINPDVHKKVEEWPFFIYQLRAEDIPEGISVVQEDESLVSDKVLVVNEYVDEDGNFVSEANTVDGEKFVKVVFKRDTINGISEDIQYKWIKDTNNWRNIAKSETAYDSHDNLILQINYSWNKKTNEWIPDDKRESEYVYDNDTVVESKIRVYYFKSDAWNETHRMNCTIPKDGTRSCLLYERNENGQFILIEDE